MITLKLIEPDSSSQRSYTQKSIVIGHGSEPEVDLPLANPQLEADHLKIYEKNGEYFVVNRANDPFVTLNGLPFGKKRIRIDDVLTIHEYEIIIEQLPVYPVTKHALEELLQEKMDGYLPPLEEEELSDLSSTEVDALMREAERLEIEKPEKTAPPDPSKHFVQRPTQPVPWKTIGLCGALLLLCIGLYYADRYKRSLPPPESHFTPYIYRPLEYKATIELWQMPMHQRTPFNLEHAEIESVENFPPI
jgi:hypothetical protein